MFGKRHDFVGRESFGEGERKPRALQAPGTFYEHNDVRINRLGLSPLRTFGTPLPDVFRTEVMDPIGSSATWKWVPYVNSWVDIGSTRMPSVSGGTRWGGGMWIHAYDMARFGYLWLRGGVWQGRRILPESYVKAALTPSAHGPDYGYLWWLNTQERTTLTCRRPPMARVAPAATSSPSCPIAICWSCFDGTRATRRSSSSGWWPQFADSRLSIALTIRALEQAASTVLCASNYRTPQRELSPCCER